jgi:hypothetical protein
MSPLVRVSAEGPTSTGRRPSVISIHIHILHIYSSVFFKFIYTVESLDRQLEGTGKKVVCREKLLLERSSIRRLDCTYFYSINFFKELV